jgi:hypothetical protein
MYKSESSPSPFLKENKMKEKLNILMKEFIKDCDEIGKARRPNERINPTFQNFIYWLDNNTWWMK